MTSVERLRPLVRPVKMAHLEVPQSYLRRLCEANLVDVKYVRSLVRRRVKESGKPELGHVIAELGGPPPIAFERARTTAALGMSSRRGAFVAQSHLRVACGVCVDPFGNGHAETFDHIRFNLCIRHRRWIGPGTHLNGQRTIELDKPTLDAEHRFRRLVSNQLVNHELNELVWRLVRDHAVLIGGDAWSDRYDAAREQDTFVQGVDDRLTLYPETIQVLAAVSNRTWRQALAARPLNATASRRAAIYGCLEWLGPERWLICEGLERHFAAEDRELVKLRVN